MQAFPAGRDLDVRRQAGIHEAFRVRYRPFIERRDAGRQRGTSCACMPREVRANLTTLSER
jgi:hypothetical protein